MRGYPLTLVGLAGSRCVVVGGGRVAARWPWEPQQVASLVTWFIYAGYFSARHNAGWHDRRGAWLLVGGFVSVIVTFVGADLLMPGSRHSFLFGA